MELLDKIRERERRKEEEQEPELTSLALAQFRAWQENRQVRRRHRVGVTPESGKSLEEAWPYFFKLYKSAVERENIGSSEDDRGLFKQSIMRELRALGDLPPNWNSYGAAVISPEIIRAARFFILSLPDTFTERPTIVPMTRGRLQLEWHAGPISLEIEFESQSKLHYLKWDSRTGLEEEDIVHADDEEEISNLINWFSTTQKELAATR
jgi:hypothetical protein